MQTPEELLQEIDQAESTEDPGQLSPITTLSVDVTGSRGTRYKGDFIFKVPTLGDQIRIGRLKSEYLPQGGAADANAAILVDQLCFLAVTIQDPKPDWWKPFELYDGAPVGTLFGRALEYERRFHGAAADSPDVRVGAGPDDVQEDAEPEADGEASVGRKVRPPSQRRETIVTHAERSG